MVRKFGSLVVALACFGGGGVAAVLVYPVLALVLYVVLVVVAIVTDTPAGGPLALPFLLVVATAAGVGYTVLALLVVGVSARLGSRSRRRVLVFVVVSILLWVVVVVAGTMVLAVGEPGMATSEALAWSVGIAAGEVPAWLVIATVWFGLRAVHGAVRWVENASSRSDRALADA
ncbi:hypothetical protein [Myceligenerans xiligouense]|uniref:Uncharacterized protein n=1 Tax=Myceligenerans xiligouense TaxID=253184 RepID=A0A3N4YRR6_9MICO|nr:hypothetical protein [Myceligenerans xiligouense]RPF22256.1 hypothetical protein EDD34_2906 [Myceligenerans xiligouense]